MNGESTLKNLKITFLDGKGTLFISDIFILLIVSVLLMTTIITVMDLSTEKILGSLERSNLERKTVEVLDNLIKNPGTPDNWDHQKNGIDIIPGLGGGNRTILFNKLLSLKKSYNRLVDEKIFQDEIKSSIALSPLDPKVLPIEFGDNEDLHLVSNVVVVKRLVKCDFLTKFKILDFKEKERDLCINPNHHGNNWVCEPFTINKKDLKFTDYYLLFNDGLVGTSNHWSVNNPKNMDENERSIKTNSYRINQILEDQIGNSIQMNFWIHIKLDSNNVNDFDGCLVAIPKDFNMNEILVDGLKIEYFQYNDCYLTLKTWFKN
ncbi:MAG: hypothetical protein LBC39_07780 [Methanobrevibacter sp.]|jgi:hypothetical protein|nr:hypothetical protein [Candidatus Methanovirga aequatorialis]